MIRKITVTYELTDELYEILEAEAKRHGRPFEEYVKDFFAGIQTHRPRLTPEEIAKHKAALARHFGIVGSGDPNSADNERIDADLAREYAGQSKSE
ncbi:MAG: hypothetical protein IT426_19830 [Pirellulales bacterium]|nr:hypothetical protein [Pirellulales bacterium]